MSIDQSYQVIAHAVLWRATSTGLQVLLQQRQRTGYLDGHWLYPGGRVELGERPQVTVYRESAEEVGVQIMQPRVLACLSYAVSLRAVSKPATHQGRQSGVNFVFHSNCWQGEPSALEPHLHSAPKFFAVDQLPQPHPPWVADAAAALTYLPQVLFRHYG